VRFTDVVARLEAGLRGELPGVSAQARLAPMPRRAWPKGVDQARPRDAAGLLLTFPSETTTTINGITTINAESAESAEKESSLRVPRALRSSSSSAAHIILTVRAGTLGRHGGQVSLPGGVVEAGETFEQAALREAHEEIGLSTEDVRVLGALTPLDIPVSGFRLHPIVAVCDARPMLSAADGEVARILDVAVDALLDPATLRHTSGERDGITLSIPGFHVAGVEIWGATAMVLAEYLALLGWRDHATG
jgi:8-oxo-dGTP pyrophosphatase MutT (NUDIX family)